MIKLTVAQLVRRLRGVENKFTHLPVETPLRIRTPNGSQYVNVTDVDLYKIDGVNTVVITTNAQGIVTGSSAATARVLTQAEMKELQ